MVSRASLTIDASRAVSCETSGWTREITRFHCFCTSSLVYFFLGSKFKILYASVTVKLEDYAVPDSPKRNLPEAFNTCKSLQS